MWSGSRERAVIVAVVAVRVMEMPLDQIVDVVAMRNRLMAALGAVLVLAGVPATAMLWGAGARIAGAHGDDVLVDVIAMHMVQMPVVQVVDMGVMLNRGVPATGAVFVGMVRVPGLAARAHHFVSLMLTGAWSAAVRSVA